jgi:hypothetical protein
LKAVFLEVFFFAADAVSLKFLTHNSTVLWLGTLLFRWILKCWRNICWVTMTESLFLKYNCNSSRCFHSENPMLYRPVLHSNWNALNLAWRALKDKFSTPMVPLTAVLPNRRVFLPDRV